MEKVIYTSEAGQEYTEKEIQTLVTQWCWKQPEFHKDGYEVWTRVTKIAQECVMGLLDWQSVETVIDELDTDDVSVFLIYGRDLTEKTTEDKPVSIYNRPTHCPCGGRLHKKTYEEEWLTGDLDIDVDLEPALLMREYNNINTDCVDHSQEDMISCVDCDTDYQLKPWVESGKLVKEE